MTEHGIDDLLHFGEQAVASGKLKRFSVSIEAWTHTDDEGTVVSSEVEIWLRRPGEDREKVISVGLDAWGVDAKREAFIAAAMTQMERFVETGE